MKEPPSVEKLYKELNQVYEIRYHTHVPESFVSSLKKMIYQAVSSEAATVK